MSHPNDDTLLQSVLEILDIAEEENLREHLLLCPECRKRLQKMKQDTEPLAGIRAASASPALPQRKGRSQIMYTVLKAAALVLIGFLAGFSASNLTCPQSVNVIPAYLNPSSPADTVTQYAVCEAVDMSAAIR